MRISLFYIGRSDDKFAVEALKMFEKRIKHYLSFGITASGKLRSGLSPDIQKETEGRLVLKFAESIDSPVLLDVKGKQFSSETFSEYLQGAMNRGSRHLGFIIGGPYGFSDEVYRSVPERMSLSSLTFSHQLVRLVFMEQLYRAMTILNGEPYHHI